MENFVTVKLLSFFWVMKDTFMNMKDTLSNYFPIFPHSNNLILCFSQSVIRETQPLWNIHLYLNKGFIMAT